MKWIKIAVRTTTQAEDLVANLFQELGLEGVEIEDSIPLSEQEKKEMFIDILPEPKLDDKIALVSSYIQPQEDINILLEKMKEGLEELSCFADVGEKKIFIEEKDDNDWINNWKVFFKPFYAAEGIMIKPTWEELQEKNDKDLVIEIDPGTAFGTGSHETTKLCIKEMKKYIKKGDNLLDVGCGSGILSIVGLKLGASFAFDIDIDPNALTVASENMKVNKIQKEKFQLLEGNIIEDNSLQRIIGKEKFDMVVANILADVIILLVEKIGLFIKKDGLFLSSGILFEKADEVKQSILANHFEIIEENNMGDWISFVAKKI